MRLDLPRPMPGRIRDHRELRQFLSRISGRRRRSRRSPPTCTTAACSSSTTACATELPHHPAASAATRAAHRQRGRDAVVGDRGRDSTSGQAVAQARHLSLPGLTTSSQLREKIATDAAMARPAPTSACSRFRRPTGTTFRPRARPADHHLNLLASPLAIPSGQRRRESLG
jgi:hypothetical protein